MYFCKLANDTKLTIFEEYGTKSFKKLKDLSTIVNPLKIVL